LVFQLVQNRLTHQQPIAAKWICIRFSQQINCHHANNNPRHWSCDFLSDGVFEPLSAAALLFFGIYYYGVAKEKDSLKKMVAIWTPITFIPLMDSFTIILLLAALSIFVWLATRAKKIRSFQFRISIFIIIWDR